MGFNAALGNLVKTLTGLLVLSVASGLAIGLIAIRLKQTQNKLHMSASFAE